MSEFLDNLPNGIAVWVPSTDLEQCLQMAFDMWKHEYPDEVVAFGCYIKAEADGNLYENGMSKDGNMKKDFTLPAKLHALMQRMTHKDCIHDKKIMDKMKKMYPYFSAHNRKARRYHEGISMHDSRKV